MAADLMLLSKYHITESSVIRFPGFDFSKYFSINSDSSRKCNTAKIIPKYQYELIKYK